MKQERPVQGSEERERTMLLILEGVGGKRKRREVVEIGGGE
jgi:hypothetical protein